MREDILEQLADDYLQARGFFTKGALPELFADRDASIHPGAVEK